MDSFDLIPELLAPPPTPNEMAALDTTITTPQAVVGVTPLDHGPDSPVLATLGTWDILKIIDHLNISFGYFAFLPEEVRRKIWKWALVEEVRNRTVLLEESSYRLLGLEKLVSPLLSVNRESRCEAKAFYEVRLEARLIPAVVPNPNRSYHMEMMTRRDLDGVIETMPDGEEVVGVVYISAIRDTFVTITEFFNKMAHPAWTLDRRWRLCSAPISEELRGKIRRVGERVHQPPANHIYGVRLRGQPLSSFLRNDLRDFVRQRLYLARNGFLSTLPGVLHYGCIYSNCTVPENALERRIYQELRMGTSRRAFVFHKYLRRVKDADGKLSWEREIDEELLDVLPHPEQTFELMEEDMEGVTGEF